MLPSVFLIGFASMTIIITFDFFYDKYRRSGSTILEFLFPFLSKSSGKSISFNDSESFATKYASLMDKSQVPELEPSRIIPGKIIMDDIEFKLFQYQNCPFCSKVRTFLDYYGIPYELIEVNPVMRQQIKFSKHYRKVPILLVSQKENPDQVLQINDSTLIVSVLNSYLLSRNPKSKHYGISMSNMIQWYLNSQILFNKNEDVETNNPSIFKASNVNDELINRYFLMIGDIDQKKYEKIDSLLAQDRRWRKWVDDYLVHVLSPNIYRTMKEAFDSFKYFSEVSQWEERFSKWEIFVIVNLGAIVMYFISKKLKKKYRLKEDVRESLYDSCNYWLKAIGPNHKFMGGDTPSLSDLTVFGALSSIEGCEAFGDLVKNTKISNWYYSMKSMIEEHQGSKDIEHLFR